MESYKGFEQGPIRPPSEASSLLLRLTRNCPWNRCTFCSVYKGGKFSLRPVADIIRDIDTIYRFVNELQETRNVRSINPSPDSEQAFFAARNWLAEGMKSIFLQDADSLVMRPENLIKILEHIKTRFPLVERITSYARSDTVARITDENLKKISAAGLNRIHIGLETASDKILGMIRKGMTKETHIIAGLKTKGAGIELSEYVLTGIGGREFSREHAIETADALNSINPDFIRFRTLHIPDTVKLFEEPEARYEWSPDIVLTKEMLLLFDHLGKITSRVKSDHMLNLLQEIDGVLPHDKERLMGILRTFIGMPPEHRSLFQVGKRSGHFLRLSDMDIPGRLEQVEEICRQLEITPDNVDDKLHEMIQERMRMGMPL
jgi:radical SAM superfamily enzyme YgiQ (UPF0313 family)